MISYYSMTLCLLSLTQVAVGLRLANHSVLFASVGDSITLPCALPSCSSVNWSLLGMLGSVTHVVRAGSVVASRSQRLSLVEGCSLHIHHLLIEDAHVYTCASGTQNSSISVEVLKISQSETKEEYKIQLHCYLNRFTGLLPFCNHNGIRISWLTETDADVQGSRFHIEKSTECFSKLTIVLKQTDHLRKWKCSLSQGDTVQTSTTYTIKLEDGVKEVFAAVGESVSFSCRNTSRTDTGGRTQWELEEQPLFGDASPGNVQLQPLRISKDASLIISKVSALHSGNYRCLWLADEQRVISRIRLHTVDVISESNPDGSNCTLTCVLTCAAVRCEQDFNLTWSGDNRDRWQNSVIHVNNTLTSRLLLPELQHSASQFSCSVSTEWGTVATKTWYSVNSVHAAVWTILPLGFLVCAVAVGICLYVKRRPHEDEENKQGPVIGMNHVYAAVDDEGVEEMQQQPQRQRATTSDSFYDLLQAVN